MISFRYHLVSLMAMFLAVAFGIVIGAAVVDQATVDLLEDRLEVVEKRADATDGENAELRGRLDQWGAFTDQAGDRLVEGRLAGTPVIVVATRGTPPEAVERLRSTMVTAGAFLQGTVWLTPRLGLEADADTRQLAELVGVPATSGDVVRRLAVARLATTFAGGPEALDLSALRAAGFLDVEPGLGEPPREPAAPFPTGTRIVVVSGPAARVRNDVLAVPLVDALAAAAPRRVLAAEPAVDPDVDTRAFLAAVRDDEALAAAVSSVDTIEDWRSRVAAVLALVEQGAGRVGHYGTGPGATSLLPAVSDRG